MNDNKTVNGLPVSCLSESGQRLFEVVMKLKKEIEDLEKQHMAKKAAMEEISNIIVEEINQIKESAETE